MPHMSRIPDFPKDWEKPSLGNRGHCYHIELLTPMFGGGVKTRANDTSFPIRPTAIRGHLQFWWRATVGQQCETLQDLRTKQSEIWGSTERASRVQVLVEDVKASGIGPCAKIEWSENARKGRGRWCLNWQEPFCCQKKALPYVLFPFQGEMPPPRRNEEVAVPPTDCIREASFRLILRCHPGIDFGKDVEPALWAWVNFGGLGSRTRRGCGALRCCELLPKNFDDWSARIREFLKEPEVIRAWPTLASKVFCGNGFSPTEAWSRAVCQLKKFRQGAGLARSQGQGRRPGRSYFPEPETIRMVTGQRLPKHSRQAHIPENAFPRAELGLPIVFHFKDSDTKNPKDPNKDPGETVLYPSDGEGGQLERMASPLILKPMALASGDAAPLILQLRTPALPGVELRTRTSERPPPPPLPLPDNTIVRGATLSDYHHSPLRRSSEGSALQAFLTYVHSRGFREVK